MTEEPRTILQNVSSFLTELFHRVTCIPVLTFHGAYAIDYRLSKVSIFFITLLAIHVHQVFSQSCCIAFPGNPKCNIIQRKARKAHPDTAVVVHASFRCGVTVMVTYLGCFVPVELQVFEGVLHIRIQ